MEESIAYRDIDTLVIAKYQRDVDGWKNARQAIQLLHEENAKLRVNKRIVLVGWHAKVTQDTLILQRGDRFYQVPLSSISNLEVSIGSRRNGAKGLAIGFIAGTAIAILAEVNYAKSEKSSVYWADWAGLERLIWYGGAVLVCGLSILMGATSKSDKWVEVPPDRLNLSLAPLSAGRAGTPAKGLRLALTFNF